MKHTEGTWEIVNNFTVKANDKTICTVDANFNPLKPFENEYNARLIAAAPELLEALRQCAHYLNTGSIADKALYQTARQAINKATQDS